MYPAIILAQDAIPHSVHYEQNQYYKHLGDLTIADYDSINDFSGRMKGERARQCNLEKVVFGYHPYWMGSNYLNYQWELLSDLVYFSYEVDPYSGYPLDIHEWFTTPAVDSAQENGVRTHLCATMFSGHNSFFSSPQSQQTLIDELIYHVSQRDADGVNIDFEAVPVAMGENFMDFIINLSTQFHSAIPGSMISIAVPAVDWGGIYNIQLLNDHIDLYMIMGYDYYWGGSGQAGPVDPLYSMTSAYDYNISRTVSYYQGEGMPLDKFVLGVPYYARQWETVSYTVPSSTIGSGTAYTYSNIQNNASGFYIPENNRWEPNSFSNYYVFYNDGWYQCFIDNIYALGKRYDIVNLRNLSGIGIWALGYDNGYTDLWDLIEEKFTDCMTVACRDTLYDSGGPAWKHYNNEDYSITIRPDDAQIVSLSFSEFELESGYDSLWLYDGDDTSAPLIGRYSGITSPGYVQSTGNAITLRFFSDYNTVYAGYEAIWECEGVSSDEGNVEEMEFDVYPNPFADAVRLRYLNKDKQIMIFDLYEISGVLIKRYMIEESQAGMQEVVFDLNAFPAGVYFLSMKMGNRKVIKKLIKTK